MKKTCEGTGLPVEEEKGQGPVTCIPFLGMELDSVVMEIRLPKDKLASLRALLCTWRGRKKGTLIPNRLTVTCMQVRTRLPAQADRLVYDREPTRPFHSPESSDIEWWHTLASTWNGVSMMKSVRRGVPEASIISDASGS
jgi:hypothetical protein